MKRKLPIFLGIIVFIIFLTPHTYAQVGINTVSPGDGSMFDITSSNKGILIPRINISNLSTIAPITGGSTESLLVYNTNTTTGKGFHYWNGIIWVPLLGNDWKTNGNTGTSVASNFVGTSDNVALSFRTNNVERFRITQSGYLVSFTDGTAGNPVYTWDTDRDVGMYRITTNTLGFTTNGVERIRILSDGRVSINDTTPLGVDSFTTTAPSGDYAVNGYSSGSGVGVYGENGSTGFGVWGNGATIGVFGTTVTGAAFQGQASGAGLGVFGYANNATGWGVYARNENSSGVGLVASGAGNGLSYLPTSGATMNGVFGGVGFSSSSSGTGIGGVGNNGNTIITYTRGSGISGTGSALGVFGYAGNGDTSSSYYGNAGGRFVLDADFDPTTTTGNNGDRAQAVLAGFDDVGFTDDGGTVYGNQESYFGGYFSGGSESSGTPTYAYAGMRYNTNNNGSSGTDFKIVGPGSNSTLIKDSNGVPRILFSPEAPEIVFQDFGIGQLTNGIARIDLDPILKGALYIDNKHPLKVYVTLEGECNGIYVTDKTADGFTVKELNGGTSNVSFSWQIVANRADTKDSSGRLVSKHVGLRLPVGPGPLKNRGATKLDTKEVKEDKYDLKGNLVKKDINR